MLACQMLKEDRNIRGQNIDYFTNQPWNVRMYLCSIGFSCGRHAVKYADWDWYMH
jgi:hypothetical protein